QALEGHLALYRGGRDSKKAAELLDENLQQEFARLHRLMEAVLKANEPALLQSEDKETLDEISVFSSSMKARLGFSLLARDELAALSIPKGSLTREERLEIESHVVHTQHFLELIPWTRELAGIPAIAG